MSTPDLFDGTVRAVLFDLDGVITDTASLHVEMWSELFNDFLTRFMAADNPERRPFTLNDYLEFVDGRPRYDGASAFLESRGIDLPWGDPSDDPDKVTVCGLANRKNALISSALEEGRVAVFPTSVTLIDRLISQDIAVGCVSSSRNCRAVLRSVGLIDRFAEILDGDDRVARGLAGKPAPDTYLDAAQRLGATPDSAVVVEDAISGVESGSAGGFRHVIGVDRGAGRAALAQAGATCVVTDLGELLSEVPDEAH